MDARQATGLGLRLLGIFFAVIGTVTIAGLVEIFTVRDPSVSGYDQARFVGTKVLAGGVQLIAGILLVRFADRIARSTPGLDGDASALRDPLAAVGFTLMGAFFTVRGAAAMMSVVQHFGGGSAHASVFGTIASGAAVQIGAGVLMWRSAHRLEAALPGGGTEPFDRVHIAVIATTLIGAAAAVLGAVDLTEWFVFDVVSTINSPGRSPDLLKTIPPLVTLGLGIALIRGALRMGARAQAETM